MMKEKVLSALAIGAMMRGAMDYERPGRRLRDVKPVRKVRSLLQIKRGKKNATARASRKINRQA